MRQSVHPDLQPPNFLSGLGAGAAEAAAAGVAESIQREQTSMIPYQQSSHPVRITVDGEQKWYGQ